MTARVNVLESVQTIAGRVPVILPGASVQVVQPGTTTQIPVYASEAGGSPVAQPLTADSLALVSFWVDSGTEYELLTTYTPPGGTLETTRKWGGAVAPDHEARLQVVESGVAVVREAPVRLKDPDIGGKGDYTASEDAAFAAAVAKAKTAFNGVGEVFIDPGKYKLTSTLALDTSGLIVRGAGRYSSVISFEPSADDNLFELGDPADTATVLHVELENFGITGNAHTDNAIYLRHLNSRYKLKGLRVINCTGTTGAALGMAAGTASHFSGRVTDCEFSANKTGAKLRGRPQHMVFDDCLIFNNTVWGIDAESDGTNASIGGRLFIVNSQVEKNGLVADTTGSVRIAGVDMTVLRDFYNEQDGTYLGVALLVETDTSVAARQPRVVLVEGGYMIGNSAASKAVILKSVNGFTRRNNLISSFTNAEPVSIEESSAGSVVNVAEYDAIDQAAPGDMLVASFDPRGATLASLAMAGSGTAYVNQVKVSRVLRVTGAHIPVVTQSGNIEVAIFDASGTRVATTGSIACPAAGDQTVSFTSAAYLRPGRKYYVLLTADNATAALAYVTLTTAQGQMAKNLGLSGQITGTTFPLPSSGLTLPPTSAVTRAYLVALS